MEEQTAVAEEAPEPPGPAPLPQAAAAPSAASMSTRSALGALLFALVAALLWLDSLWQEGYVTAVVGAGFVVFGLLEYCRIAERTAAVISRPLLLVGGLALFLWQWAAWTLQVDPWGITVGLMCLATVGVLCARAWEGRVAGSIEAAGLTAVGLVYVPLMLSFVTGIRARWGVQALVVTLAVCKVSGVGAYYAGSIIGGPRLAPRVSPRKTLAGLAGGLVVAAALSLVLSLLRVGVVTGPLKGVLYGLLVGAAAVVGDLAESVLKRQAGIKDSGQLVKGQGGILDMVDDVLLGAPLSYLFFALVAA